PTKREPVGFAVAVVRCQALLERALADAASASRIAHVDWYELSPSRSPLWLASWPSASTPYRDQPAPIPGSFDRFSVVRPLFVFSKAYGLLLSPGPAFLAAHPARAALVTSVAGGVLTSVVTVFVALMSGRRERLEQEIRARTEMLRASEESYRRQF